MSISDTREAKKYASIAEVAASQCKMYTDEARKAPEYTNLAKEYSESAALSSESAASSAMDAFSYANSSSQNSIDAKRSADEAMSSELIASEAKVSSEQSQQAAASSAEIAAAAVSKTLRVSDTDLPPLPNVEGRANKVLTFDSNGNAVASVPAGGSAEDVLIQLAKPNGASLVGFGDQTIEDVANDVPNKISGELKFSLGGVLYSSKDFIFDESSYSWFYWTGEFPKTIPENSTPGSTGGEGAGAWIGISDEGMRTQLSQNDGANLIGYGDITVASKLDQLKTPFDFGAKGDGITDDTLALQAYIDGVDGDIDLYGKTYLVSKNPALATTYPTEPDLANNGYNFCPCLALVGKRNVKIFNGKLIVKVHGMDALSLINCQNVTVTLEIEGPNKFPAIDTGSGYAEKGESRFGYNTAGGVNVLGPNNSVDTSSYNTGAFNWVSGKFPSYDNEWNPTENYQSNWGDFLGGYIGSWACGIKVQRGCKSIFIEECKIYGFNYAGIGIGIRNIASPDLADYPVESDVPEGVVVSKCTITSCYSNGIGVLCGYKMGYFDNIISNIGHPNGDDILNASFDPGYGIGHGRNRRIRNVTVSRNFITNCRRKCIDFHGGGQLIITDNFCLEHGVVGIYAKCGSGWSPNYEPYNITIANNYCRSRDIPDSTSTGPLAGSKYTRNIDVGGGGEATQPTYPHPFVKITNNYCELKSFDGVSISTGAGDENYVVFNDIDISHNTIVLKCKSSSNKTEGLSVNSGASYSTVYRGQSVKIAFNSIKQFNTLNLNYRTIGFKFGGIPKSIIAHGNTVDLNSLNQSGLLSSFVIDSRTYISFSGNQAISISERNTMTASDVIFYDNARVTIPAGSGAISIPAALFRGVWQATISGSGDAFGARQVQLANTGTNSVSTEVVRSATTGVLANIAIGASGITIPAVTGKSDVAINLKPLIQYDSVL